jgi:hypothetical protein
VGHRAGLALEGLALVDDGHSWVELVEIARPQRWERSLDFHLIPTPHMSHPKTQLLSKLQIKSAALNFGSRPPPSRPGGSHLQ